MSWVPSLHENEPSLRPSSHEDVESHMAIINRMSYRVFTDEAVWDAWTAWVQENQASPAELHAVDKFSPYVLEFRCEIGDSEEGTGCCFRDQSSKDPMGGW